MERIDRNRIKSYMTAKVEQARREARNNWREMVEAEAPTGTLATAFAAGTLVSTIPVPLVDMALAAYITRRFSELPKAPFFTGMALANNLVMAPLYAATPKVGGLVLGWLASHLAVAAPETLILRILVGYLLIALGMAVGAFTIAHTGFSGYKAARRPQTGVPAFPRADHDRWFGSSGQSRDRLVGVPRLPTTSGIDTGADA